MPANTRQDGQQQAQDPPQDGAGAPGAQPSPQGTPSTSQDGQQGQQPAQGQGQGEPETFDRAYVQQLRDEAAAHRVRSRDRDALADRLVVALAAVDGRLADPDDLPRSAELLSEPTAENVRAAVNGLLERKPHLGTRRPAGDAGQGVRENGQEPVTLLGMLRGA